MIHWSIRVFIAPIYTVEEAEQLLLSQSLQVGYEARQPPMLAWLDALAVMAGGLHPPVIFAMKYILIFIALTFYYLGARNVLIRPSMSAAAVGAWALTFVVGWSIHEDLLGAAGLMACLALCFHAFTRILTWRRYRDWVYLGVTIGVGMLTHHLFVVFPVAMLLAITFSPFFRDAMSPGRLGVAVLVAALIYAPYTVWVITHVGSIVDAAAEYASSWEIDNAYIERAGNAAAQLGRSFLEFSLPLSLFWMMLFWTLWLPVIYPLFARRNTDEEPHELAWRRLFMRSTLFAYLVSVVLCRPTRSGERCPRSAGAGLQSALDDAGACGQSWLFLHVKRGGEFPVPIRAFGAVVIAFALRRWRSLHRMAVRDRHLPRRGLPPLYADRRLGQRAARRRIQVRHHRRRRSAPDGQPARRLPLCPRARRFGRADLVPAAGRQRLLPGRLARHVLQRGPQRRHHAGRAVGLYPRKAGHQPAR